MLEDPILDDHDGRKGMPSIKETTSSYKASASDKAITSK